MILVIDDDRVLSKQAKILLENTGKYEVEIANSAIEGLEAIFNERPEAVLLDIMMPICDGITLLGMIRQSETLKDLPVIMYSSENSVDIVKKIAKYKPNGYLIKPVQANLLSDVIECALGNKQHDQVVDTKQLLAKLY